MKHTLMVFMALAVVVASCDRIKDKTKAAINKGGETVGKTGAEFFEGVAEGVDETLKCEILISGELQSKGLKHGKYAIRPDSSTGNRNLLTIYLIFEERFKDTLLVKAFDKKGLEVGRSKKEVAGPAGSAGYYDFKFDDRTHIELKSKITIAR